MSEASQGAAGEQPLDRSQVPAPGPLRPSHFPRVEKARLENGAEIYAAPTSGLPVVTVAVVLEAGGIHEDSERAGLAALTASLLDSGAGARDGAAIAEELETLGVQLEVGSGWDHTQLILTGIHSRIPPALEVLRDLVRLPTFAETEVERLRGQQLAGIVQRRAEPRGLANEMAHRFIFSDASPFSRSVKGSSATVQSLTRADVVEFHASRFQPAGTSILVAGDIGLDESARLAEGAFGDWAGGVLQPVSPHVEQRDRGVQTVIVNRPGSVQSEIRVGHLGVARSTEDFFAVRVMNTILGGAFTSRLNLNLRERRGFTYGVSSSFVMRRVPGPFLISTAVESEVTGAALREIMNEVAAIRAGEVTPSELSDARNYIAGTFPLALQTTSGVAGRLSEIVAYDLPLDYFDHYREQILDVNAAQVLAAARRHIRPDDVTIVVVGDAAEVRPQLEALEIGEVRVVDPKDLT